MTFSPRTLQEIVRDSITYVEAHSEITDANIGSVIRTILEAAALEDYEQYFQMTQILNMFSILTASGEGLVRRLADYNITPLPAAPAVCKVRFFDNTLARDNAAIDVAAASTLLKVFDTIAFPSTGFPYTVRVAEGTARVQDVVVTAVNTLNHTFTLSTPLTHEVLLGDLVSLVSGSTRTITKNTAVRTLITSTQSSRVFETREAAYITPGNYYSNIVTATAIATGSQGNVAQGTITQFSGTAPFQGAGVENTTPGTGGQEEETSASLKRRGLERIQSLSRGTPLSIKSHSIGVVDPLTGQRVSSVSLVEDSFHNEVNVYVDDGSGLTGTQVRMASSVTSGVVPPASAAIPLVDATQFPSSGYVLVGTLGLYKYGSKVGSSLIVDGLTVGSIPATTVVRWVERDQLAENGQRRFKVKTVPVVRNTDLVFTKVPAGAWTLLPRTDYFLNRGTGDILIKDAGGLPLGTEVCYSYSKYTNLIAEVQKVLEGQPDDYVSYPGVKAAGVHLTVEPPTIKRVPVRVSLVASPGFTEADLKEPVAAAISSYFSNLKIGDDVIVSKLIDAAHINGVYDVVVIDPPSNVVVLENELPVALSSTGESLIVVS